MYEVRVRNRAKPLDRVQGQERKMPQLRNVRTFNEDAPTSQNANFKYRGGLIEVPVVNLIGQSADQSERSSERDEVNVVLRLDGTGTLQFVLIAE